MENTNKRLRSFIRDYKKQYNEEYLDILDISPKIPKSDLNIILLYNQTYDPDLLFKLSKDAMKYIEAISINTLVTGKGFTGLALLILNTLYEKSPPFIELLLGPIRMVEIKGPKYHIYLFGDHHKTTRDQCKRQNRYSKSISFEDCVYKTVRNAKRFIDVFVEHPVEEIVKGKSGDTTQYNYMKQLVQTLNNECKSDEMCDPLLRLHYVDLRKYSTSEYLQGFDFVYKHAGDVERAAKTYDSDWMAKSAMKRIYEETEKGFEILRKYDFSTLDKIKEQLTSEFSKIKIDKGLQKMDPRVKEKLLKFYIDELKGLEFVYKYYTEYLELKEPLDLEEIANLPEQYYRTMRPIFQKFINDSKVSEEESKSLYDFYNRTFILLTPLKAIYMDVFLLSRLFRTFKHKRGKFSGPPSDIIVYAGDHHITNYVKFLTEYLGFKVVQEIKAKGKQQCLDLDGQQLFGWIND